MKLTQEEMDKLGKKEIEERIMQRTYLRMQALDGDADAQYGYGQVLLNGCKELLCGGGEVKIFR